MRRVALGAVLLLASCSTQQTPAQQAADISAAMNGIPCAAALYAAGKASTTAADTVANVANGTTAVALTAVADDRCKAALAAAVVIVEKPAAP